MRSLCPLEQVFDRRVVRALRRPYLAPRALVRVLVVAEADQLRPVAEAVALHLVVADLGDELVPERRLLEPLVAPAVRLRKAPLRALVEQGQHTRRDVIVVAGADRCRADVVDFAVLAVEAEQQRRQLLRPLLPAHADDDAVGGLVLLHLHDGLARGGPWREPESLGG